MSPAATIGQLLARHRELVDLSDTPLLDTELLLCHVLEQSRTWLKTWPERELSPPQQHQFDQLFERRLQGEPIAYITGSRGFWTLELATNSATLIPRPETEILVELALQKMASVPRGRGLDLGTGTGAIALALASEKPCWRWFGVDLNEDAVALAQRNAAANSIENVQFSQSDWFAKVADKFELIVTNPPYIAAGDPHLTKGDVRFEPTSALVSGSDGLDAIRTICHRARRYLHSGGWLLIEHGYDQSRAVQNLLLQCGYHAIETAADLSGQLRVTLGQYRN